MSSITSDRKHRRLAGSMAGSAGKPGRRLLFVTQRQSDFTEMVRAARELAVRGHQIHFLHHLLGSYQIDQEDPVVRQLQQCVADGVVAHYEVIDERTAPAVPGQNAASRKANRIIGRLRHIPFLRRHLGPGKLRWMKAAILAAGRIRGRATMLLYRLAKWRFVQPFTSQLYYAQQARCVVGSYRQRYRLYEALLQRNGIEVVVLPEDMVGMVSPLIIKAARRQAIGTLVLPYTIANQQEAFRSLSMASEFHCSHAQNRVVARFFPRWRMSEDDVKLLRLPGPHVVAHELLNITPPDPWMMNSGYADVIAVENEAMREYYTRSGIDPGRLRTVGAIYDDQLFKLRSKRQPELAALRRELRLADDKPLLVVGGCPNQLASCPSCEFATIEQAAEYLVACLEQVRDDYHIVLRPHPNFPELGELFERHGISSVQVDTLKLVALSDLYIAFGSATIRWSIACGIPTINYDLFNYHYSDYRDVAGVTEAHDAESFRQAVCELRPGTEVYRRAQAALLGQRGRWCLFDGRSVERIESLIFDLSPAADSRQAAA